jgi:phosphopantothenoylcysteine decarboxylase/phosphopantothenate--cysteine ligase
MPDPPVLAEFVKQQFAALDLEGKAILVTAGPTREPIDPVRYISNRSSGKMGYAIAEAARRRGAKVTLVSGPTAIPAPAGVVITRVTTAAEMHAAVMEALPAQQIVIKAAAVADFTPVTVSTQKIKKQAGVEETTLTLRKTPDILAEIGARSPRPFVVAFAAETDSVEASAREKLVRKNADLIVANDVADPSIGFDSDQNAVTVIARDGSSTNIERAPKIVVANRILDLILQRLA